MLCRLLLLCDRYNDNGVGFPPLLPPLSGEAKKGLGLAPSVACAAPAKAGVFRDPCGDVASSRSDAGGKRVESPLRCLPRLGVDVVAMVGGW